MRYLPIVLASIYVGALSPSFAAEPAAPAAPAPAAATPVSAPADLAKDTAAAKQADLDAQAKRLRIAGYKPKVQNGQTLYCRKEAVVGSRFEKEICGSPEALDKATRDSKDMTGDIQRNQVNPAGK
jgi:hypothetical protein